MSTVTSMGTEASRGARRVGLKVFSTCPQSLGSSPKTYLNEVSEVARWSEQAGCAGILVYTDNSILDPWLVSQIVIQNTSKLCPLVAVQPVYMHPYAVAKMVTSLAFLHGRQVYLNMVAGGFKNDLTALNDLTPHDKRYDRLVEYTLLFKRLLAGETVTVSGEFYTVDKLALKPPLPQELFPGIFVSGSSPAGLAASAAIGATAIQYPGPPSEAKIESPDQGEYGVRVGIIARENEDEAWDIAFQRFPLDRRGQLQRELAMKVSDSQWHKQLADTETEPRHTYWLGPFHYAKTNCPYLVGNYRQVAEQLSIYIGHGYKTYILDIPPSREELEHIGIVFDQAAEMAA